MNLEVILEKLNMIEDRIRNLEKQIAHKTEKNGAQDVLLAEIKTTCTDRGKRLEGLEDFKNKFLFMQIASNVLTLGMAFLIFRIFK